MAAMQPCGARYYHIWENSRITCCLCCDLSPIGSVHVYTYTCQEPMQCMSLTMLHYVVNPRRVGGLGYSSLSVCLCVCVCVCVSVLSLAYLVI